MIRRLLIRLARHRAEDLRWRAFVTRVFARVNYEDPRSVGASREEVQAKLLDLRARTMDDVAEWLGGP